MSAIPPGPVVALLRCPRCGSALERADPERPRDGSERGAAGLVCTGAARHRFAAEDGWIALGAPPAGKYDPEYAKRYAALWAFGYETLRSGLDESLYRTVSSLLAQALATRGVAAPVVVDCGCGVGRIAADASVLAPAGTILAIDGARAMLELAVRIVGGEAPVPVELGDYGFGTLSIRGRARRNVYFLRADVETLPVRDGVADVALSVNVIDRLEHGGERAFAECHRILRPGGFLVFTDPLNWTDERRWRRYGEAGAVVAELEDAGFALETWFDGLPYREILDRRGSFEEFTTLAALARKV